MRVIVLFLCHFVTFTGILSSQSSQPRAIQEITGYVRDNENKTAAIEGAKIILIDRAQEVITDNDGQFVIKGTFRESDKLDFLVVKEGYKPIENHIHLHLSHSSTSALQPWYMDKLEQRGFHFLIKNVDTNSFIDGARIGINGKNLVTDEMGYAFGEVSKRTQLEGKELILLNIRANGFRDTSLTLSYTDASSILDIKLRPVLATGASWEWIIQGNSIRDVRDNSTYNIFTKNQLMWMSENIKYITPNSSLYKDTPSNISFGRLYSWEDAQNACPKGWRIPTRAEYESLIGELGGARPAYEYWLQFQNALAGKREYIAELKAFRYIHLQRYGYYWTSTSASNSEAYFFFLGTGGRAGLSQDSKIEYHSCRCVMEVDK